MNSENRIVVAERKVYPRRVGCHFCIRLVLYDDIRYCTVCDRSVCPFCFSSNSEVPYKCDICIEKK